MKEKIAVAMSGGVDSSLTAAMLLQQGYEVIGITLYLYVDGQGEDEYSPAVIDAKKICDHYGIEHHVIDARSAFKESVVDYFLKEYQNGRTPNPCVFCNKNIKFKLMLDKAMELGCSKLITGHYAQVKYNEATKEYELHKGVDPRKDQSYVLYTVNQDILSKIMFPLGNQHKTKTRDMASDIDLPNAQKPDSEDICFLPNDNYQEFVEKIIENRDTIGDIVHENGEVLGKHNGLYNYTIGQRKGLGIAYEYPLYVVRLDSEHNRVIVGPNDSLYSNKMLCQYYNFVSGIIPTDEFECEGKIRYAAQPAKCFVKVLADGNLEVKFTEKQRAITPGQSVVFYEGTKVLGGAVIEKVL